MYFKRLAWLVVAATVRTDLLSPVGKPTIIAPDANHHWLAKSLYSPRATLTLIPSHIKVALMKRQYAIDSEQSHPQDAGLSKDQVVVILTTICLLLEFIVIAFLVWLLRYTSFRQWYQRRRSQRNPERQRAEQLLNAPPSPVDLEIGVIHARSPPHWPLTDAVELQIATPSVYDKETGHIQSRTSIYYDTYSNPTENSPSETVSPFMNVEELDITDTALPYANAAAGGVTEELLTNPDDSNLDLETINLLARFLSTEEAKDDATNEIPDKRPNCPSDIGSACSELSGLRLDTGQVAREATTGDNIEDETNTQISTGDQDQVYHAR